MRSKLAIGVLLSGCAAAVLFTTARGVSDRPGSRERGKSQIALPSRSFAKDGFTHTVFMEDGSATW